MTNELTIPTPKDTTKKDTYKGMNKGNILRISLVASAILLTVGFLYMFYSGAANAADMTIVLLVMGALGFLPIGLILGAMFFDISMRVKVMRALTKKNLGIINIVSENQIFKTIRNFDDSTIELNKNLYFLKKGRIYNDKDEVISELKDEYIKFIGGIPTIFFDLKNLLPMKLYEDKIEVTPEELSAPIKAWVITKEAELLKWKRATQISIIVLLMVMAVSIYYSFDTNSILKDKVLPIINQISNSPNVVSQPPQYIQPAPTPVG